jgi:hypothetical protein
MNPELKAIRQYHLQHLMIAFLGVHSLLGCGFDIVARSGGPEPVWAAFHVPKVDRIIREAENVFDRHIRESQFPVLKRRSPSVIRAGNISLNRDHIETGAEGRRLSERNERLKNEENQTSDCSRVHSKSVYLTLLVSEMRKYCFPCGFHRVAQRTIFETSGLQF